MQLDHINHLINSIDYKPSPHCDERPDGTTIDLIVIHNISLPPKQFGSKDIQQFFCGALDFSRHAYFQTIKDLKVSSHLLIDRQGIITQFVPFHKRAWHAGQSSFKGRERCNDFSIGIELEGADDIPFEDIQYQQLASIIKLLTTHYPKITRENIAGHSDIAPGRKTDPGPLFRWEYLDSLLRKN